MKVDICEKSERRIISKIQIGDSTFPNVLIINPHEMSKSFWCRLYEMYVSIFAEIRKIRKTLNRDENDAERKGRTSWPHT